MKLWIAVLMALLVGCAQTYRKVGVTQRQADMDSRYCQAVARGGGGAYGTGLANIVGNLEGEAARYEVCMMDKGYYPD